MSDARPGLFRRILFWSFALLVALMTAFRLLAPGPYLDSNTTADLSRWRAP